MEETSPEKADDGHADEQPGGRKKQVGPRVDPHLWETFKQWSAQKHGKRGMVSDDLQDAMRLLMDESEGGEISNLSDDHELLNAKLDSLLLAVGEQ